MFEQQGNDKTSEKILNLIQRHEELVAKRESLLELQQQMSFETDKRHADKGSQYLTAKRRNQKILDDLVQVEMQLKESSFATEDGKLETLKEHYLQLIKEGCPDWLQQTNAFQQKSGNAGD